MSDPQKWLPPLFGLQWSIFNSYHRYLLCCGSRKSGKTIAVLHRIMRHLWETPGARVAIFAKSIKLAKDGGIWQDLTHYVMPIWLKGEFGMKLTSKNSSGMPGVVSDSQTRTLSFTVSNMHGGESTVLLFSIDDEAEVGAKVHGKRFSMIFFSELWMFTSHRVFAVTIPQLRMLHLPVDAHMWIADTNPHPDLGNRSWFYLKWYVDRLKKFDLTTQEGRDDHLIYSKMGLIEMFSKDNPYLTELDLAEVRSQTRGDPNLYESYALGIHGDAGQKTNYHFAPYFVPNIHVVGGDGEGDQIDIDPTTTTLYTGSDLGNVNHAVVFLQKRIFKFGKEFLPVWDVLDEIVWLESREDLKQMGMEMALKMDEIEKRAGRALRWVHFTDSQAVDTFKAASGTYDYEQIRMGSGGRIPDMVGVEKPQGSVRFRAKLLRELLLDRRIFISSRCVGVIEMIREAKRGQKVLNANTDDRVIVNTEKNYITPDHKHTFDSLTYPIFDDQMDTFVNGSARPGASLQPSGLVSVG